MATAAKNLSSYDATQIPDASELTFGIVVSDWNATITHALYEGCVQTLLQHGAKQENLHVIQVPGSFELPIGARMLASAQKVDALIAIGCVIKGETRHNEYINQAVAQGLTQLSLMTGKPCIFGLLTPEDEQQARDRAGGKHGNKGVEAAITAIRMAALGRNLQQPTTGIGFSDR